MNAAETKTQMQISDARVNVNKLKASIAYAGVYRIQDLAWFESELAVAQAKLENLVAKATA